jgi:seipin
MPLSEPNVHKGNFMVDLYLLGSSSAPRSTIEASNGSVLLHSRRPALLPYHTRLVSMTSRLLFLPYHVLSCRPEAHLLVVNLAEAIQFNHAGEIPHVAYVELDAGQGLQTYAATLEFGTGKHWWNMVLYWCRVPIIVTLTTMFWTVELLLAGITWLILGQLFPQLLSLRFHSLTL